MRTLRRIIHNESGSSLVETALSLILLLTAIFGIVYFSEALYTYEFVTYAAQQGTRYAIVRGAHWSSNGCTSTATLNCNATGANVTSYVQSLAPPGITAGSIVVSPTWPGQAVNGATAGCSTANNQGCLVKVQVSYSFSFIVPFLPTSAVSFTGTSEEAIQE
jgi:Flp pilus assembly protein TadG